MKKIRVLVVDDEKSLRDFVRRNLEIRDYKVKTASNGLEALAVFQNNFVDLVILDVMMPNMDGLETIKRIRKKSTVPIIVLSALGEEQDKVKALDLGTDDYLTKPFGVKELLARVKAVQRRAQWTAPEGSEENIKFGNVVIDTNRHILEANGKNFDLTPTEFNLLTFFVSNAGKVLSHQALLQNVWGPEYGQETEYLRVYIGRLRQKIELDPSNPTYLHTEHGIGYCFELR